MTWWRRLLRRDDVERELDREIRFHLERQVHALMRQGLSEPDARRQARLEFGGLEQIKEDCRDARGTRWVEDLARDLRFSARLFARDRWLTAVAVVTLACGLSASSIVFVIINGIHLRGPGTEPGRILFLSTLDATGRQRGESYLLCARRDRDVPVRGGRDGLPDSCPVRHSRGSLTHAPMRMKEKASDLVAPFAQA